MTNEQKNFINKLKPIIEKYAGCNYCVECILAQAILESAWGKSQLAKKHFNFFGMKAGASWKGESVTLSTKEEIEYLRGIDCRFVQGKYFYPPMTLDEWENLLLTHTELIYSRDASAALEQRIL